ncbi:MAG TPA: DUF790 family protein, partial [Polyangiaceae bacterium]|nr:DUF790 family protein [Polyangiaceae bacterium]
MLPQALCRLSTRLEGERLVPQYFGERDERWLSALLDEHARFVGQRREALRARLREPLPVFAPKVKLSAAIHVLDRLGWSRPDAGIPPREARFSLFRSAAAGRAPRDLVLGSVASSLGVSPAELESALFADLPHEQRVAELPEDLSSRRLAVLVNQALIASLLRCAARVRITAWGNTRALVRHARLFGLICVVTRAPESAKMEGLRASLSSAAAGLDAAEREQLQGLQMDLSGPFALFR